MVIRRFIQLIKDFTKHFTKDFPKMLTGDFIKTLAKNFKHYYWEFTKGFTGLVKDFVKVIRIMRDFKGFAHFVVLMEFVEGFIGKIEASFIKVFVVKGFDYEEPGFEGDF